MWGHDLRRVGKVDEAIVQFKKTDQLERAYRMLEHDAAYGGSHYSKALVLKHKNDSAGARREIETAQNYWRDADPDLPELKAMADVARAVRSGRGN